MSVPVVYLPQAEDDVAAAHQWYEQQSTGLGDRFLDDLRDAVQRLSENPRMYGVFRRDIRAAQLSRFPYIVYYRDRGSDILIVAIQHGGRSTRAWRGRIP